MTYLSQEDVCMSVTSMDGVCVYMSNTFESVYGRLPFPLQWYKINLKDILWSYTETPSKF